MIDLALIRDWLGFRDEQNADSGTASSAQKPT